MTACAATLTSCAAASRTVSEIVSGRTATAGRRHLKIIVSLIRRRTADNLYTNRDVVYRMIIISVRIVGRIIDAFPGFFDL